MKNRRFALYFAGLLLIAPQSAWAMHISEGILPAGWAVLWFVVALPMLWLGLREIARRSRENTQFKPFLALVGAAVFIISCMPIPVPIAGTCSHPCGTGLAAILIGPAPTVVLASIALTLQALFMAHGGLTTLGANIVAMGVMGAFGGYGAFHLARRLRIPMWGAAVLAGIVSDWATYAATAAILSGGLHASGNFGTILISILIAFMPTQIPLGILEGVLSAYALRFIQRRMPSLLKSATAQGGAA
jgi:cobalt/nickel transport system permease protein